MAVKQDTKRGKQKLVEEIRLIQIMMMIVNEILMAFVKHDN